MHNKRVLVMTGNYDRKKDSSSANVDSTYAELNLLTMPSKERYATKHGYDFLMVRSFGTDHRGKFPLGETGNMRMYRVFRMLEEYDIVMWIDGDSIVTNSDLPVEHFGIDDSHAFYASYAWEWKSSFTTGNFILQKTDKWNLLFATYYDIATRFPHEMAAMNWIYTQNSNSLASTMKILDHMYLESIPSQSMLNSAGIDWGQRKPILYPWKEGDFLLHMTGLSNNDRVKLIQTHFKDLV